MNYLLLGNGIALAGSCVMIGIGFLKKKNHILHAQCLQCLLMGIGNLVLGGVTGFASNIITIARNLVSCVVEFNTIWKIIFIIIQVVPTIYFNNMGLIGYLPAVAACVFTWYMDTDNDILFKIIVIVTLMMWTVYDFTLLNFVAFTFDILTITSNTITLIKMKQSHIFP